MKVLVAAERRERWATEYWPQMRRWWSTTVHLM